jgi:hypothetical protein
VKKLVEMARRLRPAKKVIAYAIRKGLAALWAAGLLKRPSFGFGWLSAFIILDKLQGVLIICVPFQREDQTV